MLETNAVRSVAEIVLVHGARRATAYMAPDMVVKATRRHKPDRRARTVEMVVTVGKPNYAEREFIRQAKLSGEPFPIRKIQLKHWKE